MGSCGFNDGPFKATVIEYAAITESAVLYDISDQAQLLIENRVDSLSPIIALKEAGELQWVLDTDVRNTEGYESARIWEISHVTVVNGTDPIELNFLGHWTYGVEQGSIEIDRDTGDNSFCLSW